MKVQEALKAAIEALNSCSKNTFWNGGYEQSFNQYSVEIALELCKSALSEIDKFEPVAEAIRERDRLGFAVVNVIGKLDEIIENAQEVEVDDFLHIAIPIDKWHELQDALEEMPKRAELYTSPQPIEKCEPVALVALNNAALQKRIEILEDLLTSAAAIASRNGEGTHWKRFIGQLKVNGIGDITAKTFRILPSDEGYTSPISKEWLCLSESDVRSLVVEQNNSRLIEDCFPEDLQNLADAISTKLKKLNAAEKG